MRNNLPEGAQPWAKRVSKTLEVNKKAVRRTQFNQRATDAKIAVGGAREAAAAAQLEDLRSTEERLEDLEGSLSGTVEGVDESLIELDAELEDARSELETQMGELEGELEAHAGSVIAAREEAEAAKRVAENALWALPNLVTKAPYSQSGWTLREDGTFVRSTNSGGPLYFTGISVKPGQVIRLTATWEREGEAGNFLCGLIPRFLDGSINPGSGWTPTAANRWTGVSYSPLFPTRTRDYEIPEDVDYVVFGAWVNNNAAGEPVALTSVLIQDVTEQARLDAEIAAVDTKAIVAGSAAASAQATADSAYSDAALAQGTANTAASNALEAIATSERAEDKADAAVEKAEAAGGVLRIDSSRGTTFKQNNVSTTLTVTIFKGEHTITDIYGLWDVFGPTAFLEWSWRREEDDDFGLISAADSRLSNAGFSLTVSPADVDEKTVFQCAVQA